MQLCSIQRKKNAVMKQHKEEILKEICVNFKHATNLNKKFREILLLALVLASFHLRNV